MRGDESNPLMRLLLKIYYNLIGMTPAKMEMVQYWKIKDAVPAKVIRDKDKGIYMQMEGEKYPFPTFPRGHLLFGPLSKLKHEIKNQVFNDSWAKLESNEPKEVIIQNIKNKLFNEITEIAKLSHYDMLPPESMCISIREIHRAWTKIAPESTYKLRDYLCFILQEDDGYRLRVQWLVNYFNPNWFTRLLGKRTIRMFDKALGMLEHAEMIGDMKERIRLLRRVLIVFLEDDRARELFEKLCREIDWNKVKLTRADKFHGRGKYFKVDYGLIEY